MVDHCNHAIQQITLNYPNYIHISLNENQIYELVFSYYTVFNNDVCIYVGWRLPIGSPKEPDGAVITNSQYLK